MNYDKQKALQILEDMLHVETNENVVCALKDQQYGLSLGLVAYKNQLENWINCECLSGDDLSGDDYEYCQALKRIDKELDRYAIFRECLDAEQSYYD